MNRQFPAMRGLAIIVVVLYHSLYLSYQTAEQNGYFKTSGWEYNIILFLVQFSVFAVPVFLFISGSFFAYAAQGPNPKLSYRTVIAGLQHLLWPYLFWSLVFYVVVYILRGESYTPLGYLKQLIVGYPFHFVPLIIFFYILSPILVRLSKDYSWAVLGGIFVYQIISINLVYPGRLGFVFPGWMHYFALPILRVPIADWGIFFPLGLVYGLRSRDILPILKRYKLVIITLTLIFTGVLIVSAFSAIQFPLAGFFSPLLFVLVIPCIQRKSIPLVQFLEKAGKRSYGLYLTHLTLVYIILYEIKTFLSNLYLHPLYVAPFIFLITLFTLLGLMSLVERRHLGKAYSYVFG